MDPACFHVKHESFDFLGLPGELRNLVYKQYVWSLLNPGTDQIRRDDYNKLVALFTVNKQIRDEFMPLLFEHVVLCDTDPSLSFFVSTIRGLKNIREAHPNFQACLTVYRRTEVPRCLRLWASRLNRRLRLSLAGALCEGRVRNNIYLIGCLDDSVNATEWLGTEGFTVTAGIPAHLVHKVGRSSARIFVETDHIKRQENEWTYEANDKSWYLVIRYHRGFDVELIGNLGHIEKLWTYQYESADERRYRHVKDAVQQGKRLRREWSLRIQNMGAIASHEKSEAL